MAFKLTVANVIDLPIKATVKDGDKSPEFKFNLQATRMTQAELREALNDKELPTRELLLARITGWRGQRLVVGEDGQPAEFSAEAFECMLSLVGMELIVLNAYLKAVALADGAAEKEKNSLR